MNGALTGIVLVLLWGIVAARLPTLWRDAQQRAMWSTLCTLALTKTVATPGVNGLIGELIPNAQIIPHLLGVLAAFFLLRFLSLITGYDSAHARAARYQVLLAVSVFTTLIVLMAVTPGGIRTRGTELLSAPTGPAAVGYWVVLNGYLGTVLVIATALFWRISRSAPDRLLRNSLRAMASGTLLVAGYAVLKTGLIVAHSFDVTMSINRIEPVANALRTVGIIICLVGAVVPAGDRLRSVIRAYRALWRLRPLWNVMRRQFPDVILFPRRRALLELAGVDEVQLRLYRRVIEIRDGMLTLRDYLPAGALAEARAYVGDDPPLIEACGIALALRRHRGGAEPGGNGVTQTRNTTTPPRNGATPVQPDTMPAQSRTAPTGTATTQAEISASQAETSAKRAEQSATQVENSTTPAQESATRGEHSTAQAEKPATQAQKPATQSEHSATQAGKSAAQAERSATQAEHPATQAEKAATWAQHSAAQAKKPATQAEKPATRAQHSTTQAEKPATQAEHSATQAGISAAQAGNGPTTAQSGDRWADIGGEIADEVAWLSAVSAAYRRRETAAFVERHLAVAALGAEMASAHSRSRT